MLLFRTSLFRTSFVFLGAVTALPVHALTAPVFADTQIWFSDSHGDDADSSVFRMFNGLSIFPSRSLQLDLGIGTLITGGDENTPPSRLRLERAALGFSFGRSVQIRLGRQTYQTNLNNGFDLSIIANDATVQSIRYSDGLSATYRKGIFEHSVFAGTRSGEDDLFTSYQFSGGLDGVFLGTITLQNPESPAPQTLTTSMKATINSPVFSGQWIPFWQHGNTLYENNPEKAWQAGITWAGLGDIHSFSFLRAKTDPLWTSSDDITPDTLRTSFRYQWQNDPDYFFSLTVSENRHLNHNGDKNRNDKNNGLIMFRAGLDF